MELGKRGAKLADLGGFPNSAVCAVIRNADFWFLHIWLRGLEGNRPLPTHHSRIVDEAEAPPARSSQHWADKPTGTGRHGQHSRDRRRTSLGTTALLEPCVESGLSRHTRRAWKRAHLHECNWQSRDHPRTQAPNRVPESLPDKELIQAQPRTWYCASYSSTAKALCFTSFA